MGEVTRDLVTGSYKRRDVRVGVWKWSGYLKLAKSLAEESRHQSYDGIRVQRKS